jgi:hypothetical protein
MRGIWLLMDAAAWRRISSSMASSTASGSLKPSAPKSLMPLSRKGLCEAEMTTPAWNPWVRARKAMQAWEQCQHFPLLRRLRAGRLQGLRRSMGWIRGCLGPAGPRVGMLARGGSAPKPVRRRRSWWGRGEIRRRRRECHLCQKVCGWWIRSWSQFLRVLRGFGFGSGDLPIPMDSMELVKSPSASRVLTLSPEANCVVERIKNVPSAVSTRAYPRSSTASGESEWRRASSAPRRTTDR